MTEFRSGLGFDLHPLVLEDIANTGQRPKVEDYEGYLYIVVRMLTLHATTHEVGIRPGEKLHEEL